jgi:hypothetical protein
VRAAARYRAEGKGRLMVSESEHAGEIPQAFCPAERLVVLLGGASVGCVVGFAAAMMAGRLDHAALVLAASPFLVLALHLVAQTWDDAQRSGSMGCAVAAVLNVVALLAWLLSGFIAPLSIFTLWVAPAAAIASLVLLAACWTGDARAVYRAGAQSILIVALAAHQLTPLLMGA